jgi:hypothetical protein
MCQGILQNGPAFFVEDDTPVGIYDIPVQCIIHRLHLILWRKHLKNEQTDDQYRECDKDDDLYNGLAGLIVKRHLM